MEIRRLKLYRQMRNTGSARCSANSSGLLSFEIGGSDVLNESLDTLKYFFSGRLDLILR